MKLSNSQLRRLDMGAAVTVIASILALGIPGKVMEVFDGMNRMADQQITNPGSIEWHQYFVGDALIPLIVVAYIAIVGLALFWGIRPWFERCCDWLNRKLEERTFCKDYHAPRTVVVRSQSYKLTAYMGMAFLLAVIIWIMNQVQMSAGQIDVLLQGIEFHQPGSVSENLIWFAGMVEPMAIFFVLMITFFWVLKWFFNNVVIAITPEHLRYLQRTFGADSVEVR